MEAAWRTVPIAWRERARRDANQPGSPPLPFDYWSGHPEQSRGVSGNESEIRRGCITV
jgi:hypothetical protein